MRFKGGHNILLKGRPDSNINTMPEPKTLYLPIQSDRFLFNDIRVKEGQKVNIGDVLAADSSNYAVPLLAPRNGIVRLDSVENHIVLEDVSLQKQTIHLEKDQLLHIKEKMGQAGIKRYMLLSLGAWQYFYDGYTDNVPDPLGTPQAIIISTLSLEPFNVRGDVLLKNGLLNFTRGLEQLQSLMEYQPIYLVMPKIKSELASLIKTHLRGYASVKLLEVPLTYPFDNFKILARKLGLKSSNGPVWSLNTEGVIAVDCALTLKKPCISRIISIGGIGINSPTHLKIMAGYPIASIKEMYIFDPNARVINGGILTGKALNGEKKGIDTECRGLTVLPEWQDREFLGFVRPGWGRSSFSNSFLSSLRIPFQEKYTTAVRGELRPCISCSFCEEVCPAEIMPHLIHKYLYADLIEEVEKIRIDLCVECGLCSFVCPSKISLTQQFIEAKKVIEKEKEEIRLEEQRRKQAEEKTQ